MPEPSKIFIAVSFVMKSVGLWASVFIDSGTPNRIAPCATYPFDRECGRRIVNPDPEIGSQVVVKHPV